MSKLFIDTEFTGLHKNTTLISLGIISDNDRTFYAEFSDYDDMQCDEWIKDNVIKNLLLKDFTKDSVISGYKDLQVYGTKKFVADELKKWLAQFDSIQIVSDVCHYDFVLFIDLFGGAFDLPKNISPYCHDINQDIAKMFGISDKEAFDKSREDIVQLLGTPIEGDKHNSLYDAKVIKSIYEILTR
jgi:hypothetical protein